MSNGRSEKRVARTVRVEVCLPGKPIKERTSTENVSAHGARVVLQRKLEPGQLVEVSSPREGLRSQAQIVYCQSVAAHKFAIGLELRGRMDSWASPY
jgi:PilZ domain